MEDFTFDVATFEGFTPVWSSIGGILMGLAAIGLLAFNGRIAGISGIVGGLLHPRPQDSLWRVLFVAGLLSGALLISWMLPAAVAIHIDVSIPAIILGGMLVGLGTRIGSGCTSGHGICGVGRLAPRSLAASAVFFSCAAITVYVVRHILRGL